MIQDARIVLHVDGEVVASGSMRTGIVRETTLEPGPHRLDATLDAGLLKRRKSWTFDVPDAPRDDAAQLDVVASYSRIWGTFDKALQVQLRRASDAEPAPPPASEPSVAEDAPVRATWVLIAALILCFAIEHVAAISPGSGTSPSIATLTGLGGLDVAGTRSGQWFRLLACTFLHADVVHLACNCIAIVLAGLLIERRLGWRWLSALYLIGGIGGSLVSLASNDGHTISVGASGAAMALFGGGLFLAQTLPRALRAPQQLQLLRVLLPSLLPVFTHRGTRVDFGAHLGGTLAGGLLGVLLLAGFRRAARHDEEGVARFRRSPLALCALLPFLFAIPASAYGVATIAYPAAAELERNRAALLPDQELPENAPSAEQREAWQARYPDDPRVLLWQAQAAEELGDWDSFDATLGRARATLPRFGALFTEESMLAFGKAFDEMEQSATLTRRLLPNRDLPTGEGAQPSEAWQVHLDAWLVRYPDDPRVRVRAGWRALEQKRYDEASAHALHGLEALPQFQERLIAYDEQRGGLRMVHVMALLEQKRDREAAPWLAALCAGEDGAPARDFVHAAQLCR